MKYLFDSNTLSDIYNSSSVNHDQIIKKLLGLKDEDEIFISILTLYEFEYALSNSPNNKKQTIKNTIEQVGQDFTTLPLSVHGAKIFGELKKWFKDSQAMGQENLKKQTIDLIIAATAIEYNTVLVSADKIFTVLQKFHDALYVEDWTLCFAV